MKGFTVKIYLILLFIAGIILGFSYLASKNNVAENLEQLLDNNIVTALVAKNIGQENVLDQYAKELNIKGKIYHQYYKKIQVPKGQKPENFEPIFTTLARNFKIKLSKVTETDGTIKYIFSNKNLKLSTIELTK